ncbi:hypothetical protein TNCT_584591 [Trichonephila clavata]|uniref:Uncharacterized protein n=1 Tax=Trichonephila clavata TaxID=2740835 RepID=A0A8X6FEN3_TRICU|nr:hypothetical protein TNCT_584591 [Trichonephila clavata]
MEKKIDNSFLPPLSYYFTTKVSGNFAENTFFREGTCSSFDLLQILAHSLCIYSKYITMKNVRSVAGFSKLIGTPSHRRHQIKTSKFLSELSNGS